MIGERLQKLRDDAGAAKYFLRVAQRYAADGFCLKAIALGKQVHRLDPALTEVIELLALQHEAVGLKAEAAEWYRKLAEHRAALQDADAASAALEAVKRLIA